MADLRVVNDDDDAIDGEIFGPVPDADLIAAAGTLTGARALTAEAMAITISIARDPTEEPKNRIAGAMATGALAARLPALAEAQLDIEKRERKVVARKLNLGHADPFRAIEKAEAMDTLETHAQMRGIEVKK